MKENQIRAAFDRAFAQQRKDRSRTRRHPAEVTATRLGTAVVKYHNKLTGAERDAFSQVIQILDEIAEGNR